MANTDFLLNNYILLNKEKKEKHKFHVPGLALIIYNYTYKVF